MNSTPRHWTWTKLIDLIGLIATRYSGLIYDNRCGKTWDPGQAVAAELYGPNWMSVSEFSVDDKRPGDEPAPAGAIDAAQKLLSGQCTWASFGIPVSEQAQVPLDWAMKEISHD